MDTIVKLNEDGVDGFQSFEKQARNSTAGIGTAITVAKTQVVKGVADIIGALNKKFENTQFGSLAGFITDIGKKAKLAIDEVAKVIKGEISIQDFGKEIIDLINKSVTYIGDNIYKITDAGLDAILSFIKGVAKGFPDLLEEGPKIIENLGKGITDNFQDIIDTGLDIAVKLAEGIEKGGPDMINAGMNIIFNILDELQKPETQEKLIDAGVKIIIALAIGIVKAIFIEIPVAMGKLQAIVINFLLKLPKRMVTIGQQIVQGIWQGIVNRTGKFGRDMDNWVNNAVARVKKKLGIKSPSRVFRDEVGKMMAEGIGVGFNDGIKDVYGDIQHAINLEQAKLQANVETGRVFNTLQSSTPVVINLNADVEMDSTKVGRLVTPAVTKTIKNGGGV